VSRSGTLTYEVAYELTRHGLGVSTAVGIGGDPIPGTRFTEILGLFEEDPMTSQVVLIGEIGGSEEEEAASFIATKMTKPVTALIAGQTAPPDKRMGHAGAIISGGAGTAQEKIAALQAVGVQIARYPEEVAAIVARREKG
jgi:succinyl-CoA synthetase alpha subunit